MACESVFLKMRAQYLTSDNIHWMKGWMETGESYCMGTEALNFKHYLHDGSFRTFVFYSQISFNIFYV